MEHRYNVVGSLLLGHYCWVTVIGTLFWGRLYLCLYFDIVKVFYLNIRNFFICRLLTILLLQWTYLEHHGLLFTPPYEPHRIPVTFLEEKLILPPEAEEVANYWCQAMESDYGSKEIFIRNFWQALMSRLPKGHIFKREKAKFDSVDFTAIKTVRCCSHMVVLTHDILIAY